MMRRKPDARRAEIIDAAIKLAKDTHYTAVQRKDIASALGVTPPTINYHFKTLKDMRDAIMCEAVRRMDMDVVVQGLVGADPIVLNADPEIRRRAITWLCQQSG